MAGAGLLLGRSNDPDVVAELAGDRFEQLQPARIHAVVVGEENSHQGRAYAGARKMLQLRTVKAKIAPYSQQLGDFFTPRLSVLVNTWRDNYRRELGKAGLTR